MNILLIDKRIQDYETIVAAIDPALAVGVVFDYYEDTFDAVKARIGALGLTNGTNQISVGLIQHNYKVPMFTMLASADVAPVAQVESQDPELERWTQFRDFITWCKTEFNSSHFDLMACALYSDPDWKYVIDTLTAQTGVTVRASTDDTGAASLGGDWFLESHTSINLKTVYFTEAIEAYRGVLYLHPFNIREYSTKGFAIGKIQAWGNSNDVGTTPWYADYLNNIVAVYSTSKAFAALKTDGSVVASGDQYYGGTLSTATYNSSNGTFSFTSVADNLTSGVVAVYSTSFAFAALKSNGSVVAWGLSTSGGVNPGITGGVIEVYSSAYAFAALKSNGSVQAWGDPNSGGTTPGNVSSGVVAVYSNNNAFAALKSDGSVVTWGSSGHGGANPGITGSTVSIYSTSGAFAALKSDGSVQAWGDSNSGGTTPGSVSSGVVAVYSTNYAFAALKSNGSVVAWGWSEYGGVLSTATWQTGLGYYYYSSVASNLASHVVAIYSTNYAFAALKSNGSVQAWGDVNYGGGGQTNDAVEVYSTAGAFAALRRDGSIAVWGASNSGGTNPNITGDVVAVYSNEEAFTALITDGSIRVWGASNSGGTHPGAGFTGITNGVVAVYSTGYAFASLKTTATTFDLSMLYYRDIDRYNILRKIENRRRVNLTTLNNMVFTLSAAQDIQLFNRTIPSGITLNIIVPTYQAPNSYSITSAATIPSGAGNVIIACDEGEPVTISGTTYVNYGSYVYKLETGNTYTKVTTAQTISGINYMMYGGDGVNSSGIALIKPFPLLGTFTVASNKTFGDASFNIATAPTSDSSGAITYSSSNTSVATIDVSGTWITLVGAGDVSFNATQQSNEIYSGATKSSNTLTVARGTSDFSASTFSVASSKIFGDASFNIITAPSSTNSNGAITYSSSNTAVATIDTSGTWITLVAAGDVSFNATQAQTEQYASSTKTSNTLTVDRGTTSLTSFSVADSKTFGDLPFSTTAPTSDSSGAITYSSNATGVATINPSSGIITLVAVGTATFTASQAQSARYNAPTPVTSNTLTVLPIGASSGAVTYTSSNPAVATVGLTTGLVTPLDIGSVTITASQASSAQYNAPTNTTFTITIGAAADLSGTTVTTSLANKNLTGISLVNTVLTNVSLSGTNLSNANFSGATVTGANFTNADISGATNLPAFSTTQKLQLLRNANNAAISAVQISTPLSGAEINAAITTPIPDISGATFVVKAPAYNVSNEKVVTVTAQDVSNNASLYIPMNSSETVTVNGVAYTFNGTNILDSSGNVVRFITILGKPFRLYAGSIVGLNIADKLNTVKIEGDGLYDIIISLFAAKT